MIDISNATHDTQKLVEQATGFIKAVKLPPPILLAAADKLEERASSETERSAKALRYMAKFLRAEAKARLEVDDD